MEKKSYLKNHWKLKKRTFSKKKSYFEKHLRKKLHNAENAEKFWDTSNLESTKTQKIFFQIFVKIKKYLFIEKKFFQFLTPRSLFDHILAAISNFVVLPYFTSIGPIISSHTFFIILPIFIKKYNYFFISTFSISLSTFSAFCGFLVKILENGVFHDIFEFFFSFFSFRKNFGEILKNSQMLRKIFSKIFKFENHEKYFRKFFTVRKNFENFDQKRFG